jgi:hypothetical protein
MSSHHFTEIPKPSPGPTGAGAPLRTEGLTEKAVQAVVAAGAVTVEGSMDGTNYVDIGGGAIAANTWLSFPYAVKFMRLNVGTDIGAGKVMLGYSTDA